VAACSGFASTRSHALIFRADFWGFIWGLLGQKSSETHKTGRKQKAKKPHCNAIF